MRIRELFNQAVLQDKKLFIPYLTCGDPNLATTELMVERLSDIGADVIELGVPFSDPVADGRINQRSSVRALKQGVSLLDCFHLVKALRTKGCAIPLVLFTYFNPVYRFGLQRFAQLAQEVGVDAVLVVDLPVEEAEAFAQLLSAYQIGRIALISPTTTIARVQASDRFASEFLYYVSRTGVTGTQTELSLSLEEELTIVKQNSTLPIAVGFGITNSAQASAVAKLADGVVVGSALVQHFELEDTKLAQMQLLNLAQDLRAAI